MVRVLSWVGKGQKRTVPNYPFFERIDTLTEQYEGTGMNLFLVMKSQDDAIKAMEYAESKNVLLKRLWPKPFHKHRVFERVELNTTKLECAKADEVSRLLTVLPVPPGLLDVNIEKMCQVLKEINEMKYIEGWF